MKNDSKRGHRGISTTATVVVVVVLVVASVVGAEFLFSKGSPNSISRSSSISTTYSTVIHSNSAISADSSSTSIASISTSYQGTVAYSPSCFALYSGPVHVFGTVSPIASGNIKSVQLYWSYHSQNQWYLLNDLTYGSNFANNGNFSHMWNPPMVAFYDFEANWTLSDGQVIMGITSEPFQVVAQGSSCS